MPTGSTVRNDELGLLEIIAGNTEMLVRLHEEATGMQTAYL